MIKAGAAQSLDSLAERHPAGAGAPTPWLGKHPAPARAVHLARAAFWPTLGVSILLIALATTSPTVNGVPVPPGWTVERATRSVAPGALRPGDRLDIRGRVVRPGGGRPPMVLVNGEVAGLDHRLRLFECAIVRPGPDKIEPRREVAIAFASANSLRIVRYIEGQVSGERARHEDISTVVVKSGPRIALTFDDGPHPRWTPKVLDLLKKYGVRATFFVLGPMCKYYPSILRREIAEGHEIGCHSWAHPHYAKLSAAARARDLSLWESVVVPILGHKPTWFRPPYGSINAAARAQLRKLGYRVVLWTVDTSDWRKPPATVIAQRILNGARRDGAIILMHDGGGDRSRTVAALAMALPQLVRRGVQMLTLSQLKGLAPTPPPELVVISPGGAMRVRPRKIVVSIDGQPLDPAPSAALCGERLLVAVRPVCQALNASVAWDGKLKALTVDGPAVKATLRLNSTRVTVDGRDVKISVPIIRAGGVVMAPVHLLARLTGSLAVVSADLKRVDFRTSPATAHSTLSTPDVLRPAAGAGSARFSAPQ